MPYSYTSVSQGNSFYNRQLYKTALSHYQDALTQLQKEDSADDFAFVQHKIIMTEAKLLERNTTSDISKLMTFFRKKLQDFENSYRNIRLAPNLKTISATRSLTYSTVSEAFSKKIQNFAQLQNVIQWAEKATQYPENNIKNELFLLSMHLKAVIYFNSQSHLVSMRKQISSHFLLDNFYELDDEDSLELLIYALHCETKNGVLFKNRLNLLQEGIAISKRIIGHETLKADFDRATAPFIEKYHLLQDEKNHAFATLLEVTEKEQVIANNWSDFHEICMDYEDEITTEEESEDCNHSSSTSSIEIVEQPNANNAREKVSFYTTVSPAFFNNHQPSIQVNVNINVNINPSK